MLAAEGAPTAAAKFTVLVVDDHALLRTGVANIINQEADLRVVAEAGNGVEAVAAFERHHPDITLLDLRMPIMEGVEAVRHIRARDPGARVIVLTTYDTDDEITRALKAGAKAYVLKDISADDLIGCIRAVLAGAGGGGQAGRGSDPCAADAARDGGAAAHGGRQGQQGDRRRARHQRAHGQDAPRPSLREARRDEPDRSDQGRHAARTRSPRVIATRPSPTPSPISEPKAKNSWDQKLIDFLYAALLFLRTRTWSFPPCRTTGCLFPGQFLDRLTFERWPRKFR
jgi:CheY-like chemotaxis protein